MILLMALEKEIIVLGDIEMGAGNLTDDFISDNALTELIEELCKRPHAVDLVLNGDTFDFLKCPYFSANQLSYPRHITSEISINKLNLIYHAHNKVFRALKKFCKDKNNRLYFNIGNHDTDLVYHAVQKRIKELLSNSNNIYFKQVYRYKNVHVEHGQQYDFLTKINFDKLFLNYRGKEILNQSFISFGLISRFMHMKEKHPFLERIFPRKELLKIQRRLIKKLTRRTVGYFIKSMLYYPLRYFYDPTYTYPRELFRELYIRLKNVHWDVDKVIPTFKRKKKHSFKKDRIFVLGHIHEKFVEDKDNIALIHPGSWRDEYDLDVDTRKLIPRPKRYVQILITDVGTDYQIIEIPTNRTNLNFDKVINNELKHVKLVAKEEKFHPALI
jgi:hypothetical protein